MIPTALTTTIIKKINIVLMLAVIMLSAALAGYAVGEEDTKDSKDKTARSSARVNPTSLGMEFSVPLGVMPGRAGNSLPITFNYSSKVWNLTAINVPEDGHSVYWASPTYGDESMSGWTTSLQTPYFQMTSLRNLPANPTYGQSYQLIPKVTLHLMDGSTVELAASLAAITAYYGTTEPYYGTFYSYDGSNLKLVTTSSSGSTLYMPDGSKWEWLSSSTKYTDRNGNVMSVTTNSSTGQKEWKDTLGRTITVPDAPRSNGVITTGDVDYYVPTMPEREMKWTFKWRTLENSFGNLNDTYSTKQLRDLFYNVSQNIELFEHDPVVLKELVQPDGRSFKFYYNEYGEMEKIEYPTGATEKFTYSQYGPFSYGGRGGILVRQGNRGVDTRTVSVDSNSANDMEWDYDIPTNSTSKSATSPYTVKTTNPDGTRSERLLFRDETANTCVCLPSQLSGKAYEENFYDANNTLVRRQLSNWTGTTSYTKVDKTVSIMIEGTSALAQATTFAHDSYLNVTRQTVHDFTIPSLTTAQNESDISQFSNGTALKTTETTYITDSNYINKQMVSMPSLTTVKTGDQYGSIVAKSETTYDDSGYGIVSSSSLGSGVSSTWVDPNTTYRGNPTSLKTWKNTDNSWITTHAQFDQYGNLRKSIDAKGNVTETQYHVDYACAYPTKTISPTPSDGTYGSNAAFETTATFDYTTGLPLTATDINSQTTTMEYDDDLLRPTKVTPPTGGAVTETTYNDTVGDLWVKTRTQIDANNWSESITYFDSLGRAFKSKTEDTNGDVFTEKEFDYEGRPKRVTNPFRTGETKQWTTNTYDEQSRVKQVDLPDTTNVKTDYGISTSAPIGITKTVTDQAGKKRKGISDAFGRMVRVIEDPANQALNTDYTFDTLGNLRKTTQGDQNRYFMHDSLGRLLYAKQPEQDANSAFSGTSYTDSITSNNQWSVKYVYDDNGNITSTTDAKNVSITASYDNLNRIKERDYDDSTPDVDFYNDGKGLGSVPANSNGKTTKVTSSVSETRNTSFDANGRLITSEQRTDGTTYPFEYTYDLSGALIEQKYPSGRVVKNVLDHNGDLSIVQSKKNSTAGYWNYASNFSYDSAGNVKKMQLGNGHWETAIYNERLQVKEIGLGITDTDQNLLKLEFKYEGANPSGNVSDRNNGSMREQKITVPTVGVNNGFTATQSYAYDDLNRLLSATETISSSQSWKQTFTYDRYGNRRYDATNTTTLGSCSSAVCNPTISTSTNRISQSGYTYDSNGSLTVDGNGNQFFYDAENHQTEVKNSSNSSLGTYLYDGDGKRVKKVVGTETTVFVYDAAGQLAAEYSTTVASSQDAKVAFMTTDHLGSPRVVTDQNGATIDRKDFNAFGDETISSQRTTGLGYASGDALRRDYTGYEKDAETGLEFAQARFYNPQHGRFTSADPLMASANVKDPQTLNRYSYALNSPYKFTDPLGLVANGPGQGAAQGTDVFQGFRQRDGIDISVAIDISGDHLKFWQIYDNLMIAMYRAYAAQNSGVRTNSWSSLPSNTVKGSNSTDESPNSADDNIPKNEDVGIEVIIWDEIWTTNIGSTYGHASYIIDGVSWSFDNEGFHDQKREDYLTERRAISGGTGYVLDFGSPELNQKFKVALLGAYNTKTKYDVTNNNCASAFLRAINTIAGDLGVPLNDRNIKPKTHGAYIQKNLAPYIYKINTYPFQAAQTRSKK